MKAKKLIIVLSVLLLVVVGVGGFWHQNTKPVHEIGSGPDTVNLTIEEGSSLKTIAQALKDAEVIRSPMLFSLYARFSGKSVKLRAGEYKMPLHLQLTEVVDRLVKGEGSSNDITVTIPEGFNNAQVYAAVRNAGIDIIEGEFVFVTSSGFIGEKTDPIYDGKPEAADMTGYIFPDTYKFFGNSSAEEVVTKMVDNLRNKLTDTMKQEIAASPYTFYQILTLASIVEKEVRTSEERKVVAGIFLHRLADNYPLESDATLNFITGKKDTTPSASDVAIDSPYNSYAHAGLPPTPICNPGITAIQAVLEPTASDYYFFLTTPEGKAVYSETYDQHLQQKAQYYP